MTVPAYVYARYSTSEQGRGTSLRGQFEDGERIALERGWLASPDRRISDKGVSAFHGANRSPGGALHAFERRVEKGFLRNGAVLVVEHLDRISRQGWEEIYAFLKLMTENRVSVFTTDGMGRLYNAGSRITPEMVMELVWKAEGAREQSDNKSRRSLRNWRLKIDAVKVGRKADLGLPPAWMDRDKATKVVTLNEHRTAVLREIYTSYSEGLGLPSIVRLLNGRGEPSWGYGKRDKGNGWNTAYLGKLLANRAALGEYEPMSRTHGGINETSKGIRVPDYYPQAIPADLFERVQAQKSMRRFATGPAAHKVNNLLSGTVHCHHCGAPMYYQSQQRAGRSTNHRLKDGSKATYVARTDRSYLICNGYRRAHACDNGAAFRYELLEPAILDAVLTLAMDDRSFQVTDVVDGLTASVAELRRIIEGKRHNLNAIVDGLADHFVQALAAKAADMEASIEADEARLAELEADLRRETGGASPEEHIQRVREVRASLSCEDDEIRWAARARIRQALGQVARVRCDREGVATLILANGLMAWRFNTQGELLGSFDLRGQKNLHRGLTSGELADNANVVDAVLRRSKAI